MKLGTPKIYRFHSSLLIWGLGGGEFPVNFPPFPTPPTKGGENMKRREIIIKLVKCYFLKKGVHYDTCFMDFRFRYGSSDSQY